MKILAAVAATLALAACGMVPGLAQLEGGTTVLTEKPFTDHVVSWASGKNCSSIRREKGMTYCVEDELQPKPEARYCYRELGRVTCYDRPDPYAGRYATVEETPSPAVAPGR